MALPAGRVTNDAANYFAFALQSSKDTAGTTFYFLKHLDGTGFDVAVDKSSERIGGSGKEIGLRYRKKVTADGQFVSYADPDATGRVLYAALGNETLASSGGLYQHTITSGASLLPYYTMDQSYADENERVTNALVSDLKIEFEAGMPVKFTTQFVVGGTPYAKNSALSPTRESNPIPFMMPGASVAITALQNLTVGASLGGATSLQVTKGSVEIKNTLDDAIQTVALNREDVLWLNADYEIDGTLKYIDRKFWEAVQYGGGSQVPTGALTGGQFWFYMQVPSQQSLQIFCPYLEFTGVKLNRLDPDGKTVYLDWSGATRNIGSQALQCTVSNNTSTSYTSSST